MVGDDDSVDNVSMTPHGKTHERNAALSFNRVRQAMPSKIVGHHFINGKINPKDILSKHWAHPSVS